MLVCVVFCGCLVRDPIRVVLMYPFMMIADPPIAIMPDMLVVIVAENFRVSPVVEARTVVVGSRIAGGKHLRASQQYR